MSALMVVEDGEDDGFVVDELTTPWILLAGSFVIVLEEEDILDVKSKVPGPVLLISAGSG